jgi:hypothetical protein
MSSTPKALTVAAVAALTLSGCAAAEGHGTGTWTDPAGNVSTYDATGSGTDFHITKRGAPTPAPTVAPQAAGTPTPAAAETGTVIRTGYTTGYGYWDNTPAGSTTISNPVTHKTAGGTGTWADPATVAVGHTIVNGKDTLDYPAGTRIYIPNLRKYFIVEDTCGDGPTPQNTACHNTAGSAPGVTVWVDVWVGGQNGTHAASDACESTLTDGNGPLHTLIINPSIRTYPVVTGDISGATCRANYGNTVTP